MTRFDIWRLNNQINNPTTLRKKFELVCDTYPDCVKCPLYFIENCDDMNNPLVKKWFTKEVEIND